MTKTDELLRELDNNLTRYLKRIGEFTVEKLNDKVRLIGHYKSTQYRTCCACGKSNIIEIFKVTNSQGEIFEIGSECIQNITNENLLQFYKAMEEKKSNINKNSGAIEILNGFIPAIENGTSPIPVSKIGLQRLTAMNNRMCYGLNPLDTQWKLFYYYMRKLAENHD